QTRAISFDGLGEATGFEGNEVGVAQALGNGLQVQTQGSWQAGAPVLIDQLAVLGDALSAVLAGQIDAGVFDGDIALDVRSLAPFAALADRPLAGALALDASGTFDLASGGFDLALDGLAQSVQLGSEPVDALLAGDVTLSGGIARSEAGLEADGLRLDGRHIAGTVDGLWASQGTDLSLDAQLADLAVLTDRASGAADLSARATGEEGPINLTAQLGVPQGRLVDQTLRDAALDFDGMLDGDLLAGALTLDGLLGSAPITASMHVRADSEVRVLSDIAFATRGAALAGDVRQQAESGLLDGALRLEAQDIRTLALLALVDASGAVNADVQLSNTASKQNIAATGTANSLAIEDLQIGTARFDVDVAEAFGVPRITGTLNGQSLQAGDITITRLDASSAQSGSFSVTADGINAPALRSAGLGPARLRADGAYGADTINLSSATLTTGGVEATASGRIPLSGGSMDVSVRGNAPLSLAEPFLADRGTQLSGTAALNARITGALSDPSVSGTLDVSSGQVVDPGSNLRLTGITASARLTGDAAVIEQASAQVSGGGTVNLSGRVGLDGDLPADLRIGLRQVRYTDGTLVVTTADGDLTLTGPLARGALLGGTVRLLETNIQIPDSFGDAGGFIELDHIAPSERIRTTFERAQGSSGGGGGSAGPALRLDVQVSAPSQIYVRGRGVNAELGGAVRLTGSLNSITPIGAFNLIRGRIDILGQRIALSEGSITLVGDLDPFLNIVAQTDGDAIVVVIAVRGRVSDPTVTLSSQPELPQDEVLARLIFDRSLNELSPLQIAQLALAAAELAGQSNGSALGSLRDGLGLSDLDVVTDDAGNPAVRAGQYVQENVYVGVEASTDGSARTTINLDITEDITARGAVGSDGESSLGIFFERDY
ncbi:MAG: translocation/assembly module TamB domain-containing protein, partial [Devosiaceae bacterium]